MKSTLKAPGTEGMKPKHDELPSKFAFRFNLRRYSQARQTAKEEAAIQADRNASARPLRSPKEHAEAEYQPHYRQPVKRQARPDNGHESEPYEPRAESPVGGMISPRGMADRPKGMTNGSRQGGY